MVQFDQNMSAILKSMLFLVEFSHSLLCLKKLVILRENLLDWSSSSLWYPNKQGNLQSFLFVFIISLLSFYDGIVFFLYHVHTIHRICVYVCVAWISIFIEIFFLQRISIHSMHSYENVLQTFDQSVTLSVFVCSTCEYVNMCAWYCCVWTHCLALFHDMIVIILLSLFQYDNLFSSSSFVI